MSVKKLGREPTLTDMLPFMGCFDKMGAVSNADARAQGIFVPGTTMQTLNDDGTVKETIVLNHDGTRTTTAGGVHGIPTEAPDEFVKQQKENTKMFAERAKKDDFPVLLGNSFRPECVPRGSGEEAQGVSSCMFRG